MSKKLTAMQELIKVFESHQSNCIEEAKKCRDKTLKKQFEAGATSYTFAIIEAKKRLELEKQNLIDAYAEACIYSNNKQLGEQYYNNTFNQ